MLTEIAQIMSRDLLYHLGNATNVIWDSVPFSEHHVKQCSFFVHKKLLPPPSKLLLIAVMQVDFGCDHIGYLVRPGGGHGMVAGWPPAGQVSRGRLQASCRVRIHMLVAPRPCQTIESLSWKGTCLWGEFFWRCGPGLLCQDGGWSLHPPIHVAVCPMESWDREWHSVGKGPTDAWHKVCL